MFRIGEVVQLLGLSADTLRYYEKIGLLPKTKRSDSGIRYYNNKDLSRIRFILRAKKMSFRLDEITKLLQFREGPQEAKPQVRLLASQKLAEIEDHLAELSRLRDELKLLTQLCSASSESCPILTKMDET